MVVESCPSPSFPHAFSGNPGETQTGPPIKTFGGDNFGERYRDAFMIPRSLLRGSSIFILQFELGILRSDPVRRRAQAPKCAFLAQDGDHLVDSGADGRAGEGDADGLSQLAHR
jgi:hypothetical protein